MKTIGWMRCLSAVVIASAASAAVAQAAPPDTEDARKVVALVEKAAARAAKDGKAAYPEFRTKGSEWYQGNLYLFAYDMDANELLNAAFPEREGQNRSAAKDANGKPMVSEFIRVARTTGSGWVDYVFPKPGQSQPSKKWAYVKGVTIDGIPALIAAGFYPQ